MSRTGLRMLVVVLALLFAGADHADTALDFEQRAEQYLASAPEDAEGSIGALARLAKGLEIERGPLEAELKKVAAHQGGIDFDMVGIIRLMYLYRDDPRLTPEIRAEIEDSLLRAKYWIDEPGKDDLCFWSENHQIAYHSDEYLAGALLPDKVFVNSGMTGKEHMEKGKRLALQWMAWRAKYGFSEWFSNVYYTMDLYALLNLADFAPDPEVRTRAAMIIDILALNMALNSYKGYFLSTHGRTYVRNVIDPEAEGARYWFYLWWGEREKPLDMEHERTPANRGAMVLSTSSYRLPAVIYNIGRDRSVMENYQTHGLDPADAPAHGLDLSDLETGMFFWGQGMYTHPAIADTTARMWEEYDLYGNRFFRGFAWAGVALARIGLFDDALEHLPIASSSAFLGESRTYTYRSPDYILSSVLDHRKGELDAQMFAWVAGLSPEAFVFTTHPGKVLSNTTPDHWVGNGANPRVAQYKNVLAAVYNAPLRTAIGEGKRETYTHAWFPRAAFDEVKEEGGWYCGRKGDGYVALFSRNSSHWVESGEWSGKEIKAPGLANIWLCEMGRQEDWGSFEAFAAAVSKAEITFERHHVLYHSPSQGPVSFGWDGPFTVNGEEIPLQREMRYDNPFVQSPRFSGRMEVKAGGVELILDFEKGERIEN